MAQEKTSILDRGLSATVGGKPQVALGCFILAIAAGTFLSSPPPNQVEAYIFGALLAGAVYNIVVGAVDYRKSKD